LGLLRTDPKKWYEVQDLKPPHWLEYAG